VIHNIRLARGGCSERAPAGDAAEPNATGLAIVSFSIAPESGDGPRGLLDPDHPQSDG